MADSVMLAGSGAKVVLKKLQLGVVFKVKVLLPAAVGVPVAVSTMFCPLPTVKDPEPEKVTPLAVVEIMYVPAVVTLAVMVCVTPDTATPAVILPAEAVEQVYAETIAVPLVEGSRGSHFIQFTAAFVPKLVCKQFRVVLKMLKPLAGLAIASRSAVVIRGNNIPWLLLTASRAALALGLLVPIPTCAMLASEQNIATRVSVKLLIIVSTLSRINLLT
jgi:hypothetical protein